MVETACPLDCPDTCSLTVSVEDGRIASIDASPRHELTVGRGLRQGAALRRPRVRRGSPAAGRAAHGPQGRGQLPARVLGRSARRGGGQAGGDPQPLGRRGDPTVLLRRLERARHPGHRRRTAVPPARRQPSGAHRVRRADRRRGDRPVRRDAGCRLPGLSARAVDRGLGRQPIDLRHAPGAPYTRRAARRRSAGGHRPAPHDACQAGRHPPAGAARRRRGGGASAAPVSVRAGAGG